MRSVYIALLATVVLGDLGVLGCANAKNDGAKSSDPVVVEAGSTRADDAGESANTNEAVSIGDGGKRLTAREREEAARVAKRGKVTRVGAMNLQVSVIDRMAWPESKTGAKRIGYLRHGSTVEVYEHTFPNDECKDGWYELVAGGFLCAKGATTDLQNPRVRLAPKQPDMNAGMPYRYGVNVVDDTPLYRKALGNEDRKKYEPWLVPPKAAPEEASGGGGGGASEGEKEEPAERASSAGEAEKDESAGARTGTNKKSAELDAGTDAGRPKLKELKGRGVLVRKMARGFYLALDKDFRSAGARWWRTTFGLAVPFERIMVQPGVTKHHGTWFGEVDSGGSGGALDGGLAELLDGSVDASSNATVANVADAGFANINFVNVGDSGAGAAARDGGASVDLTDAVAFVTVGFARKLELSADGKKMNWGTELPKRSAVLLTGREVKVAGVTYHQTSQGFWVQLSNLNFAKPAPPADLGPGERWIDVDITRQALVAFEGTRPIFATLVSTGRRNPQDKEHDFPTPPGTYRIREKHVTTTMDGDVASDGPYSIEDVPWVMYFDGSYALHGAFWHDQFGRQRSHGCVNLAPEDARMVFGWAEPRLPEGWHGIFSTDEHMGSRVIVHEDPPVKR